MFLKYVIKIIYLFMNGIETKAIVIDLKKDSILTILVNPKNKNDTIIKDIFMK